MRLRVADGFSHARSLAYATALMFVQAIIAVDRPRASRSGTPDSASVVVRTVKAAVPGPGGNLLTEAVAQAHRAGASHRYAGSIFGLVGALITGSTLLGQLERGLNRIYGVEQDRPDLQKYGLALGRRPSPRDARRSAHSRCFAFGQSIGDSIDNAAVNRRVERRALAARGGARDARDHDALPVVAAPAPAGAFVARVRRGRRGRSLAGSS